MNSSEPCSEHVESLLIATSWPSLNIPCKISLIYLNLSMINVHERRDALPYKLDVYYLVNRAKAALSQLI